MSKQKALRLAAHYAKQREAHLAAIHGSMAPNLPISIPDKMELGVTPEHVCRAFWVYANGIRQTACRLAIASKEGKRGYIEKWPIGKSGLADQSKPLIMFDAVVEIVPAGQPSKLFMTKR